MKQDLMDSTKSRHAFIKNSLQNSEFDTVDRYFDLLDGISYADKYNEMYNKDLQFYKKQMNKMYGGNSEQNYITPNTTNGKKGEEPTLTFANRARKFAGLKTSVNKQKNKNKKTLQTAQQTVTKHLQTQKNQLNKEKANFAKKQDEFRKRQDELNQQRGQSTSTEREGSQYRPPRGRFGDGYGQQRPIYGQQSPSYGQQSPRYGRDDTSMFD
jgi:septal ring factor EnvC (AmiA/AmiB activator)